MPATARQPCRVGPDPSASPTVLDALRRHEAAHARRYGLDPARARVLRRLMACRTEVMGTHKCVCDACGWSALVFNSCRDRHCPGCQGRATAEWLEARQARMLPTPHFQVVFTIPAELREVTIDNQERVYALLFSAATSVLADLAAQRWEARPGITAVLHTWTSELTYHPHLHCIVTGGGLHVDDDRWISSRKDYLFPGKVLGAMFRGRFLDGLIEAFNNGELQLRQEDARLASRAFRSMVRALARRHKRWVVHVEPPNGRSVDHIAKYLARYVKRVAISDARIVEVTDTSVVFRTKTGTMSLDGAEFVRRFTWHILPPGFRKVRHYGLYAPGNARHRLEQARRLLGGVCEEPPSVAADLDDEAQTDDTADRRREACPACGERRVRRVFVSGFDLTAVDHVRARGPP